MLRPALKSLQLAQNLRNRPICWGYHGTKSAATAIDSEHGPSPPEELLVKVNFVTAIYKPEQFEIAGKWMSAVDLAAPRIVVQVYAMVIAIVLLKISPNTYLTAVHVHDSEGKFVRNSFGWQIVEGEFGTTSPALLRASEIPENKR
jgi:hypothetical protein